VQMPNEIKRKVGRPRKDESEVKSRTTSVRLTGQVQNRMEQIAEQKGLSMSQLITMGLALVLFHELFKDE